jgi:hypothetical protein
VRKKDRHHSTQMIFSSGKEQASTAPDFDDLDLVVRKPSLVSRAISLVTRSFGRPDAPEFWPMEPKVKLGD